MKRKIHLRMLLFAALLFGLNQVKSQTVVDIIVGSAAHNTLETAVIAAGLADDLSGVGPFTVFAPTDNAFATLPEGTLAALLEDPTGTLADILLYHVLGSKAMSTDLSGGQMITTLLGKDVEVTINGNGVFIKNAKVTVVDLEADNGVVHVIDAVLLPPAEKALSNIMGDVEEMSVYPNTSNDFIRLSGISGENNGNLKVVSASEIL